MRKNVRRLLFCLVALLIAAQAPFIYRRYEIGRLQNRVEVLSRERRSQPVAGYRNIKGIIHAHTSLGGHSTGKFDELIDAANSEMLDFVVMTEHYSHKYNTAALTLNGVYGKTLFVGGQEADANDGGRYLIVPGGSDTPEFAEMNSAAMLEKVHSEGKIAINNYPDRSRAPDAAFDGMEIYSLHINAKQANPWTAVPDMIWSFPRYPEFTFATYFRRNNDYLRRFDSAAIRRRIFLTAGADAHSNIGYYLLADDQGHRLLGFKIDPYSMVFRLMRMHYLIPADATLDRQELMNAIRNGHGYVGFDILGDSAGFNFTAANESSGVLMGDEIPLGNGVRLNVIAPLPARFVIFRNGEKWAESGAAYEFSATANTTGVYRVEVYLDALGPPFDETPWIISNPIYVR